MNDPDNFFSRWSRRKLEAGEPKEKEKKEEATGEPHAESVEENEPGEVPPEVTPKRDVESLPPLESISAETDVTAFMRTGVPEAVKRAALRRAWSSDPEIRDFVGLNENFWDAAGPEGIAGFGDLEPGFDVKRMTAELFGEAPRQDESSVSNDSETKQVANSPALPISDHPGAASSPQPERAQAEDLSQRNKNIAAQTEPTEPVQEKKIARRHGGAMPH